MSENGNGKKAAVEVEEGNATQERPMSAIERAQAADKAAREEEAVRLKAAEDAGFEPSPLDLLYHPDGSDRRMVICRPDGRGEREVTAKEWETNPAYAKAVVGAWVVKYTEVVSNHHSDNAV